MACAVSRGGVIGIFQGIAESGPRALGHRSILADPRRPDTLEMLNRQVKFREPFRPLAPMATLEAAEKWFHLPPGLAAENYNALNYMVLAVRARDDRRSGSHG